MNWGWFWFWANIATVALNLYLAMITSSILSAFISGADAATALFVFISIKAGRWAK